MAKGKSFSDFDQGKIIAFRDQGLSNRKIAEKLGVSHVAVNNFFKKVEIMERDDELDVDRNLRRATNVEFYERHQTLQNLERS